ncbi:hypothetical protein RGQ29_016231 [Quercus rubra]|uniref:Protein N-terminal asparagine amidohydrolase n=1 Tax=Quercus rubra TaxID=3512 RepID=A0AAN7FIC5_QUERU|nr:hypothetical protein RGQ29_016231 [Quercus rubra]
MKNSAYEQGSNTLVALMEDPILVSALNSFKAIPERKFFLFCPPSYDKFVGTDEATTCVCLVIHHKQIRMTSVAHMDSPNIVDMGLSQMSSCVIGHNLDAELDVHLVGGFEDVSPNLSVLNFLCNILTLALDHKARHENFHVQNLSVLGHNTRRDSKGNAYPIFNASSGLVTLACFDRTSRCPDEIVRRIQVTASYEDPSWSGRLLETYDTQTDQFRIASCCWSFCQQYISWTLQSLSNFEILLRCSTSPSAEAPDFVYNLRRYIFVFIVHFLIWRETFPRKQPRVFKRAGMEIFII